MLTRFLLRSAVWTVLLAVSPAGASPGAQILAKPAPPAVAAQTAPDPAALALRDRILRTYRSLRGLHEKVTQRQWQSRPEDALTVEIELRFRRPNRLYLAIDYPPVGSAGPWRLVYACDGRTLTLYNGAANEFETVKSPAKLDRLVLPRVLRGPEFIALLRGLSPFDDLEKSAAVQYGEAYEFGGAGNWRSLKLELRQDGAKRTLQYRVGPKDNLIHGLSLAIVPDPGALDPFADPEAASSVEASYSLVDPNPRFSDADFRFTPPAGARRRVAAQRPGETERPAAPSEGSGLQR